MSTNLKGRTTASFNVEATDEGGTVTITITDDSTGEEWRRVWKVATPITASERRLNEQVSMYVWAGLDEDAAIELASQVNSL